MATVLMKLLETKPSDYDRGIQILTLGQIQQLKQRCTEFVQPGDRVLEIGCGTGTLSLLCAQRGAEVVAVDASAAMLAEAEDKVRAAGMSERVVLRHMDATLIAEHLAPASFDLIVSTLVFSEMDEAVQSYVLQACRRLLKPRGQVLIADEVAPEGLLARLSFLLLRAPLVLLTWLITRTSTAALHRFTQRLALAGFSGQVLESRLGGSLQLFRAWPADQAPVTPAPAVPRLHHRVTLWTRLKDLYGLLWRNIPPYPKVQTGLYQVGRPNRSSPVLVTGNYDLTVRRLLRDLDGRVDAWLLVANSEGINVWCGAGGGHFTAEKIIAGLKTSALEDLVEHRRLILPQLCANGVKGQTIEQETGWRVRWGPCYSKDIPAYLEQGQRKTEAMRWVRFPLLDRVEMAMVMWALWGWLMALILALVRPALLLPALLVSLAMFLFLGITWPWWPTRDGFLQGIGLALLALALLTGWSLLFGHLPVRSLLNWGVGLTGIGLFVGADFQGGVPFQRGGELEHFWKLVPIGLLLVAIYLFLPRILGW